MTTSTALLVSMKGLDDKGQKSLLSTLKDLQLNGINFELNIRNLNLAHLVVIDDDDECGKAALKDVRDGQVKLLLSSSIQTGKNLISLQKPIDKSILENVLKKIYHMMYRQINGSSAKNQERNKHNQLFNIVLTAKENNEILKIHSPSHPVIYCNGQSKSFATATDDDGLKTLFKTRNYEPTVSKMTVSEFTEETKELPISALPRLLWICGLYGSEGVILDGHSTDTPIKLRGWPNFTRNDFIPEHLKIAAVLARQSTSLLELEEKTRICQTDIINFYNAAYAVDLIEVNASEPKTPADKQILPQKHKGLFSKLAEKLRIGA